MKLLIIAFAVGMFSHQLFSQSLSPGDPAPKLLVGEWVKGKPVNKFEKNNFYVVEFWATWCGPCMVSIPRLTALARKYPSIPFIGISVAEMNTAAVKPFVAKMGDKMNYHVAIDKQVNPIARNGWMSQNWLNASGSTGIPTAFIVGKNGTIEFIGLPDQLDSVIKQLQAGKWNVRAHHQQRKKQIQNDLAAGEETGRRQQQAMADWNGHPAKKLLDSAQLLSAAGKNDLALRLLDKMAALQKPGESLPIKSAAASAKMNIYRSKGDKQKFYTSLEELFQQLSIMPGGGSMINEMLWVTIIDPKEDPRKLPKNMLDYTMATRWMEKVVKRDNEKNHAFMDSLAWAYFQSGNKKAAIAMEQKAIARAGFDASSKADYQKALDIFNK